MSDYTVRAGTIAKLGRIDGELKVGRNARIEAESGRKVEVTEGAYFEGPVTIDCDFECKFLRVEGRGFGPGGDVLVHGDLTVHESADMNAAVKVDGKITTGALDVGGHLASGSVTTKRFRVGGHVTISGGLIAEDVDVGGHMKVSDQVEIDNLRVGGHAEVGGGTIKGEIKVHGQFTTTKKLDYGQVNVYGNIKLPAGSNGQRLTASGRVEFEGDQSCESLEINGSGRVAGAYRGENVKVNGRFEVSGPLTLSKELDVYGAAEVKGDLSCDALEVAGKLTAVSVDAGSTAKIAGGAVAPRGLKARSVIVGLGSRVVGPIVGEEVEVGKELSLGGGLWSGVFSSIGKMTAVDDVHGKVVRIGRYARAKRIFAESVEMENGSIAEEITYTKDLRLPMNFHLTKPAVRVGVLPQPPF